VPIFPNKPASGPRHFPDLPHPQKAGAGFKSQHLNAILAEPKSVGFFEIHAENYMGAGGAPHAGLRALRERFPLSVHGVGLSIGSAGPLDQAHLAKLKTVVDRYEPFSVSEHLAWSTHDTTYFNDLLPVPYTDEVLVRVCDHIDEVQEALERRILLENPSTYVAFTTSTMGETDFIRAIASRTGCGLLLDLNNVFVSATNHGFSAEKYLADFPLQHLGEIHLAGHAVETDDEGKPLLIDAHDRTVCENVWALYDHVLSQVPYIPTLIEWDNDVPDWQVLKAEAKAADVIATRHYAALRHAS
jgi:uncharacterized protein